MTGRALKGTRPRSSSNSGLWAAAAGTALASAKADNGLALTKGNTFQQTFVFDNPYVPVAGAVSSSNAVSLAIGNNAQASALTTAFAGTGAGR
jgi:hypothetical protein